MFDFDQDQFRFRFGDLLVIYNRKKQYLLVGGIGEPGYGDHLRFEVPTKDADENFDLRPHVTARGKGGKTRRPFKMKLPWERVVQFINKLAPYIDAGWRGATRRVDLDDLTEQDLVTIDAGEEEQEAFMRKLVQRGRRNEYQINLSSNLTDEWFDYLEKNLTVPSLLDPERSRPGLYPIFRIDEETGIEQVGVLNYFPRGPSDGREPGWYFTDLKDFQRAQTEAFEEVAGAEFFDVIRKIKVAFGHGPELSEQAEALLARAQ